MRQPSDLLRVDGLPLHRLRVAAESRTPSRPTLAAAPRRAVHSTRSVRSTPAAASPHSPPSYRRWSERPPLCPRAGHDTSRVRLARPLHCTVTESRPSVSMRALRSTWYRLFLYGDRRRGGTPTICHTLRRTRVTHIKSTAVSYLVGDFSSVLSGWRARETCASPPHGRRGRWRCWR